MNQKRIQMIEISRPQAFKLWLLVTSKRYGFSYAFISRLFDAFGGVNSKFYQNYVKKMRQKQELEAFVEKLKGVL